MVAKEVLQWKVLCRPSGCYGHSTRQEDVSSSAGAGILPGIRSAPVITILVVATRQS